MKAPTGDVTEHFLWADFACKHCGEIPSEEVIRNTARFAEAIRARLGGQPMTINSGYRCPVHNARVGGASDSMHLRGWAIDITVKHLTPRQVQARLRPLLGKMINGTGPLGALGSYRGFSHLDRRTNGPAEWNG